MKRIIKLGLDCWTADPGPLCMSICETVETTDGAKVSDMVMVTGALVMAVVEMLKLVTVKGVTTV